VVRPYCILSRRSVCSWVSDSLFNFVLAPFFCRLSFVSASDSASRLRLIRLAAFDNSSFPLSGDIFDFSKKVLKSSSKRLQTPLTWIDQKNDEVISHPKK
jgi:hypothetical protein